MPELLCKAEQSIGQGGFMLVRFNNPNGTHGYETIDFRRDHAGGRQRDGE